MSTHWKGNIYAAGYGVAASGFSVGNDSSSTNVIDSSGNVLPAGEQLRLLTKKISISADFDNTEQDTGWDLPTGAVVYDVVLNVTTADASQTLDVGTDGSGSNDPNGFLAGASVNATGLVKGTLDSGGQTRGALLYADESGAGVLVPEPDVSSGGESVTYTGSDTTNTMRGDIYIVYAVFA
jgi:hypothetical protein